MGAKYQSKKTIVDGLEFDSRKEAARYKELRLLERAGAIQNLYTQYRFQLIPAHYEMVTDPKTGKQKRQCIERACSYVADFVYTKDGKKVVEDTKGFKTKDYILKRKMMLYFYGIRIQEI